MANIQLEELVLLGCEFEMWPERTDEEGTRETPEGYPSENVLQWRATSRRDGDEFHLYLDALLDDVRLPFRFRCDLGARFTTTETQLAADQVEPTLLWLAYPYLRELVSGLTGRSPLNAYYLPPLTRLPDPTLQQE